MFVRLYVHVPGLVMPSVLRTPAKGQLVSKYHFGVFTFFQTTNENKSTSSKVQFVVGFFEET